MREHGQRRKIANQKYSGTVNDSKAYSVNLLFDDRAKEMEILYTVPSARKKNENHHLNKELF